MKMTVPVNNHPNDGFTIIEIIVTTVILTIFLILFFQSYMVLESQRIILARSTAADQLATTNLRKVTSRSGIVANNISCVAGSNGSDLFATGSGYTPEPQSSASDLVVKQVGQDTVQQLQAYPSSGSCSGTSFGTDPIRIVSRVIYKVNGLNREADHASYVY